MIIVLDSQLFKKMSTEQVNQCLHLPESSDASFGAAWAAVVARLPGAVGAWCAGPAFVVVVVAEQQFG